MSSIDVVPHKEIVRLWDLAANFKELDQIMKLSVDVSADDDRSSNRLDVGFFDEYFHGLSA